MAHYVALWLLVHLAGRLPLAWLEPIADTVGTLAWWASRRLREVTRDHMRHVLGPSAADTAIDRAARACARSAARGYTEFAHLPHLTSEQVRARVTESDGMDDLSVLQGASQSVIVVSAHLGAPELLSRCASVYGLRLAAISEPLQPPRVHNFVHRIRALAGTRYLPATLAGLREARVHLATGGAIGLLADRDVLHTGRPYAFFGERALMPTGAVDLALRTQMPLFTVWCLRSGRGRYRLVARRLPLPATTGDRQADLDAGMRVLIGALEAAIREAPGQWFPLVPIWSGLAAQRSGSPRPYNGDDVERS